MPQWVAIFLVTFIALWSIAMSNALYDEKVPNYLSRKLAHVGAGIAFVLSAIFFNTGWTIFGITAAFAVLIFLAKWLNPTMIRGIGGAGRPDSMAELWFPLACATSIGVGWLWLGSPWLGVLPCLFVSFGDAVTGLVRSRVYRKETKGLWGTWAMLATCLGLAFLVQPVWIGHAGAVVATIAEMVTKATRRWDDNPALILGSTAVMGLLYWRFT